jgi:hypothetical protein
LGGKGRLVLKADNLTAICELIAYKMWEPQLLTNLWASTAYYRDSFMILYKVFKQGTSCKLYNIVLLWTTLKVEATCTIKSSAALLAPTRSNFPRRELT